MLPKFVRSGLAALIVAMVVVIVGQPRVRFEQRYRGAAEPLHFATMAATLDPGTGHSSAQVLTRDFSTIGVRVDAVPATTVEVRWRSGGAWSAWHALDFEPAVGPDPATAEAGRASSTHGDSITSEPVWIGSADGYQVRGGEDLGGLSPEVVLVRPDGVEAIVETVQSDAGADTFGRPAIHPRSDWGARAPAGSISTAPDLKLAVVHHADTANDYSPSDVPGILRSIQAFHIEGRGWSDIGYNFAVDKFGGMWEGRSGSLDGYSVGAHAEGFNTSTIGVVALGNYETAQPTNDLISSIGEVIAWRFANAFIDPTSTVAFTSGGSPTIPAGVTVNLPRVVGHRDVGATDCPGQFLYNQLSQIRLVVNGRTADKASPFGVIDLASPGPGQIYLQGWTIDPSTTSPIDVHVYIDGVGTNLGAASDVRSDLTGPFPYFGAPHGYHHVFSGLSPGPHVVCVFGINQGLGSNTLLECRAVTILTGSPIGRIAQVIAGPDGTVFASGEAYDPDVTASIQVHVYLDGQGFNTGLATANHAASWIPTLYGSTHGFDFSTSGLANGPHDVCIFAINVGVGDNTLLGCSKVSTPSGSPFGRIDTAFTGPDGALQVSGWAIDPDVSAAIAVHLYIDAQGVNLGPTTVSRPDLAAAFPGYGATHGFSYSTTGIAAGVHQLCAYGINVGVGANSAVQCKSIIVPGGPPVGVVDTPVTGPDGLLALSGWALDPNTVSPIQVHVYIDGVGTNTGSATVTRSDVAGIFPQWGGAHGFAWNTTGLSAGKHSVCVFGIDRTGDANTLLRCINVTVPGGSPTGAIDSVRASGANVIAAGWTIDPDVTAAIPVHIYVDDAGFNTGPTTVNRPDLAAVFPGYGTVHGFSWTHAFTPGVHNVCIYGINSGAGANSLLGCRTVTTS